MKDNWREIKLKDICSAYTGRRPSRQLEENTGYFSIGGEHITVDHRVDYNKNPWFILPEFCENLNSGRLDREFILLVKDGATIGKCCYFIPNRNKYISAINEHVFAIEANENLCSNRFLYYFLLSPNGQRQIDNCITGAAQPGLNRAFLDIVNVFLPSLPIQQKIASILSAYDDLIELNERRIKILDEIARLIYKEWFVKFRFPWYEKIKMVESELGKIPEGWEVKSILDIESVNLIKARVKRYNGVKEYFATANVEGIDIIKDGEMVTYDGRPSRAQMQPEENTIWFAKMRETYKVLCFASANKEKAERSILSSGFAGLKVDRDILGFVYFTVNSKEFHNQKDQFCTGATQMSSTIEGLNLIKIVLPDKNLVRAYSELTKPMIDQIIRFQQQNCVLRQTRDMLLPKLISGQIEVSNLDIKVSQNA